VLATATTEWIRTGASVAGTIATFLAIAVALWQSNQQQRRRVSVRCAPAAIADPSGGGQRVFSVGVDNVGFRPITLSAIEFVGRDGRNVFVVPHRLSATLPAVLADGESATILFAQQAVENGRAGVDGYYAVAARDSVGNRYFTRFPGGPSGPLLFHHRRARRRARRERKGPESFSSGAPSE